MNRKAGGTLIALLLLAFHVAAAEPTIEGPTWRLTALRGLDAKALRVGEEPVTARFQEGRVSGFSGCNRFFGGYTLDGDRIVIGQLAGSMMMCPEASMTLEHALTGSLAGTFQYAIAGKTLTLRSGTEPVLTFEADASAVSRRRYVEGHRLQQRSQRSRQPVDGNHAVAHLQRRRRHGNRRLQYVPRDVHRRARHHQRRPCGGDAAACVGDGVAEQEAEFLSALQSATVWTLDGRCSTCTGPMENAC